MNFSPAHFEDFYKVGHKYQYPKGTTVVYSNDTARYTHVADAKGVINFGQQAFVKHWLIDYWTENFFRKDRDEMVRKYKRRVDHALGIDSNPTHIGELHEMGYLPIRLKSIPEGMFVPLRVPFMTQVNTEPRFFWLTNFLETLISCETWKGITSATTAFDYFKRFHDYAGLTGADPNFVQWQGHDFSFRGMSGVWDAMISGAAHLAVGFTGTDTIPAIDLLEELYGANVETELVGGSVPATEHSVMCMDGEAGEFETFRRLICDVYPKGIVSIVSDTWDLWTVLTNYLPRLRDLVKARNGKLVIRPDSGDPVKILLGDSKAQEGSPERKGVIRLLYEVFGGTVNSAGYIELDPHIGAIYGDSITPDRQEAILSGLMAMGFASSNVVLGIGSFTYQYVTRDTYGQAIKATYAEREVDGEIKSYALFKKPKTDSGGKNSAKGLLYVGQGGLNAELFLEENVDKSREEEGMLQTIYWDGVAYNLTTLAEIRKRVRRLI